MEIIEGRRGGKKAADGGHPCVCPESVASCFSASSENVSAMSRRQALSSGFEVDWASLTHSAAYRRYSMAENGGTDPSGDPAVKSAPRQLVHYTFLTKLLKNEVPDHDVAPSGG